jgi:hypothetical protein
MAQHKRANLKVVELPTGRTAVSAPPIFVDNTHTVDYCCGSCGAVLLHADEGQVRNLLFHCTLCETYNSTDS